jgi:cysteine synthase
MIVAESITDLIGKTPLVRINRLTNQMTQQSMQNLNGTTSGVQ